MHDPMGTDQFLNQISTLIFGWEIVDLQWSTKSQLLNLKSTKNQPTVNQISTIFQHWHFNLIFGCIVVGKLIFAWSLLQNQWFLNQISTLRMVEESWASLLNQRWFNIEKLICAHWGVCNMTFNGTKVNKCEYLCAGCIIMLQSHCMAYPANSTDGTRNFWRGASRGKLRFWGGKNPKICRKWLILAIFSSDGGQVGGGGAEPLMGGCKWSMPLHPWCCHCSDTISLKHYFSIKFQQTDNIYSAYIKIRMQYPISHLFCSPLSFFCCFLSISLLFLQSFLGHRLTIRPSIGKKEKKKKTP